MRRLALGAVMWMSPVAAICALVVVSAPLPDDVLGDGNWSFILVGALLMPLWVAITDQLQALVLGRLGAVSDESDSKLITLQKVDPRTRYVVVPRRYGYGDVRVGLLSPAATPIIVLSEPTFLRSSVDSIAQFARASCARPVRDVFLRLVAQYVLGVVILWAARASPDLGRDGSRALMVILGAIGWAGIKRLQSRSVSTNDNTDRSAWPGSFGPEFWSL